MEINEKETLLINEAIKEAESHTSGEVVPVILRKSDFYPVAHFRLALIVSILFAIMTYYNYDFNDPIILIWSQVPGMIVGFLLAYIPALKRLFTTNAEMQEEVHQRAIQIFHENKVSMTKGRTGIMIFISLLERKVEVLADCGINEKVEKNYWNDLVQTLIGHLKEGKAVEGIIAAIESCGKSLKESFPREDDDKNEIPDVLIID